MNDHGVLLGAATDFTNVSFNFTSRNGVITRLQSPAGTNHFGVTAINNNGDVVGQYQGPTTTNELGHVYHYGRAFLQTATTNLLLGEAFPTEDSAALGINDRGEVVGFVGPHAAYFRPLVVLDDPNIGGEPTSGSLNAVNESGVAVGRFIGAAAFWTNAIPGKQTMLWGETEIRDINDVGQMVGQRSGKLSIREPVIWEGTNAMLLGSHIAYENRPIAINDRGAVVGMANTSSFWPPLSPFQLSGHIAILWTNGVGLNLNTLVELTPAGHFQLTEAVAINESGQIAATLIKYDGTSKAVILEPENRLDVPAIRVVTSATGIVTTNSVTVTLSSQWPNRLTELAYVLHHRWLQPATGGGDFWEPPRWHSRPLTTNHVGWPSTETSFNHLPPGQYALCAVLRDITGVEAFLPAVYFTIAGPPTFTAARRNFRGVFEYMIDGGSGYQHQIEESTNMVDWTPAIANSFGGAFDTDDSNQPRKFFRARVTSVDPEYFGQRAAGVAAHELIPGMSLLLLSYENRPAYELRFVSTNSVEVESVTGGLMRFASYTQRMEIDRTRLSIELPELQMRLEFQLQWAMTDRPHNWRVTEIRNGQRTELEGRFFTAGLQLRPYAPPHPLIGP